MAVKRTTGRARGSKPNGRLTAQDIFVRREADGTLIPITVDVPELGKKIKVLPTTIGSIKGLTHLNENSLEWPLDEKVRYVREHVVDPDLREFTEEQIAEDMTMWDLDNLLNAAINAGGSQRSKLQKKA